MKRIVKDIVCVKSKPVEFEVEVWECPNGHCTFFRRQLIFEVLKREEDTAPYVYGFVVGPRSGE